MSPQPFDHKCPWCGEQLEGVEAADGGDDKPTPGSVTVCIGCGLLGMFDDDLGLRVPTKDEMFEVWQDPVVRRVVESWLAVMRGEGQR